MSNDLAPIFLRADLAEAAQLYKNKKVIKTVVRRWQGKDAKFSAVLMGKADGKYIVKEWGSGTFDMQNRQR